MNRALENKSSQVRKSIESHKFTSEDGEEYDASSFGGFDDYFRRKKIKLQNLDSTIRAASGDKPQIFRGVVAHVSGYTQPSLQVLHKELVQHGAGFLQYLDGKTMATHIIASALTPKKMSEFARYRIVKPAWVTDSIAAGRLLPWANYKVIGEGVRQKTLTMDPGKGLSWQSTPATPQSTSVYKEQSASGFYGSQFRSSLQLAPSPREQFQTLAQFKDLRRDNMDDDIEDEPESYAIQAASHSEPLDQSLSHEESDDNLHLAQQAGSAAHRVLTDPVEEEPGRLSPDEENSSVQNIRRPALAAPKPTTELPANPTPEQYNAWLLSDPHYRNASSANPNFLQQFYSESRLHHLSTWKAELKSKMQRIASAQRPSQATRLTKRPAGARCYVLHVDFDSFFCAVSLKSHPGLADKPVVVAHSASHSSEIASCNYPARRFGISNGMWMKRALEMCPSLTVLPYDFPAYEAASEAFYDAVIATGGVVQSVSIDEVLIDATQLICDATFSDGLAESYIYEEQQEAEALAASLRQTVKERTGCDVSVGIGQNILQAKVALRKAKPAGQYLLRPEDVLSVIGSLETKSLPGVAASISGKLSEHGIVLVQDLRALSKDRLSSLLGPKTGEKLWAYARGLDDTRVGDTAPRKSVSAEVSWGIRFITQAEADEFMGSLCRELERRLLVEHVCGKNLTLKVMRRAATAPLEPVKHLGHGVCDTFNKSVVFGMATNSASEITREAVALLRSLRISPGDIRGLGVQLTKLEPIREAGSQKRLTFPSFVAKPSVSLSAKPPVTPATKQSPAHAVFSKRTSSSALDVQDDPISEAPLTPRKNRLSASSHMAFAAVQARERDDKATSLLNIAGTQFMLPANADPAVVAELPVDIRAKLIAQGKPKARAATATAELETEALSSHIDPEVFAALPADMKAEVLATYGLSGDVHDDAESGPSSVGLQHVSPRREQRTRNGITTPPRRVNRTKARERMKDAERGLMQTSFRVGSSGTLFSWSATRSATTSPSRLRTVHVSTAGAGTGTGTSTVTSTMNDDSQDALEGLDMDVLKQLPEDVRREVIQDYRRQRQQQQQQQQQQQRSAPERNANTLFTVPREPPTNTAPTIPFPAHPPKVVFSSLGTSSEEHIRAMVSSWLQGTVDDGPHVDDVDIFGQYIARVVFEERDMEKALRLVRWMDWKVRQVKGDAKPDARRAWDEALDRVKDAMREAARARGIPPINI